MVDWILAFPLLKEVGLLQELFHDEHWESIDAKLTTSRRLAGPGLRDHGCYQRLTVYHTGYEHSTFYQRNAFRNVGFWNPPSGLREDNAHFSELKGSY